MFCIGATSKSSWDWNWNRQPSCHHKGAHEYCWVTNSTPNFTPSVKQRTGMKHRAAFAGLGSKTWRVRRSMTQHWAYNQIDKIRHELTISFSFVQIHICCITNLYNYQIIYSLLVLCSCIRGMFCSMFSMFFEGCIVLSVYLVPFSSTLFLKVQVVIYIKYCVHIYRGSLYGFSW